MTIQNRIQCQHFRFRIEDQIHRDNERRKEAEPNPHKNSNISMLPTQVPTWRPAPRASLDSDACAIVRNETEPIPTCNWNANTTPRLSKPNSHCQNKAANTGSQSRQSAASKARNWEHQSKIRTVPKPSKSKRFRQARPRPRYLVRPIEHPERIQEPPRC